MANRIVPQSRPRSTIQGVSPTFSMSFANAAVSKGIMLTMGLTSLLAGIFNAKMEFSVPLTPHLTRDWQLWRLVTHHLCFANSAELLLGLLIVYNCGATVERFFGSVKFASFALLSCALSTLFSILGLVVLYPTGYKVLPAGPFGLIASLLYQYYCIVPFTYRFEIFGGHFSNKSFQYFFAIQMLSCDPAASLIPALSGLLAGILIRSNALGMRHYRLPSLLIGLASYARPLLGNTRVYRRSNRVHDEFAAPHRTAQSLVNALSLNNRDSEPEGSPTPARRPPGRQEGMLGEWREAFGSTARARPTQVDAEAVSSLRAMFPDVTQQAAEEALRNSNNDVNRAVEQVLVSRQS